MNEQNVAINIPLLQINATDIGLAIAFNPTFPFLESADIKAQLNPLCDEIQRQMLKHVIEQEEASKVVEQPIPAPEGNIVPIRRKKHD
jgi:hypothetical protein